MFFQMIRINSENSDNKAHSMWSRGQLTASNVSQCVVDIQSNWMLLYASTQKTLETFKIKFFCQTIDRWSAINAGQATHEVPHVRCNISTGRMMWELDLNDQWQLASKVKLYWTQFLEILNIFLIFLKSQNMSNAVLWLVNIISMV